MQNYRNDAKSSVFSARVAGLAQVLARQSVLHVEVDVQDIVAFLVLHERDQLLVLVAADLVDILRVKSLLREVCQDSPTPVVFIHNSFRGGGLNTHSDKSSRHQERNHVFGQTDNFANFLANLLPLLLQLLLLFDQGFIRNLKSLELFKILGKFSFDLGKDSFVLELVE